MTVQREGGSTMPEARPPAVVPERSVGALRWGISSLGCGELTLPDMCGLAGRFGIDALELRSVAGRLDLPAYLAETYPDPAAVRALLGEAGVRVVVLDSSFKLVGGSVAEREELRAFACWADALQAPYIRVFGGGTMERGLSGDDLRQAAAHVDWWSREKAARGWKADLILETHDGFSAADRCLALQDRLAGALPVLWDTHHTWKLGGEEPAATWRRLGPLVRHVHIKDSVSIPSARHPYSYVMPGTGEFPALETLDLLAADGYGGVVCLEWERKWHPYLPPLEEALAALPAAAWRPYPR
jgi:sugar phosphate isomerase/epimerase